MIHRALGRPCLAFTALVLLSAACSSDADTGGLPSSGDEPPGGVAAGGAAAAAAPAAAPGSPSADETAPPGTDPPRVDEAGVGAGVMGGVDPGIGAPPSGTPPEPTTPEGDPSTPPDTSEPDPDPPVPAVPEVGPIGFATLNGGTTGGAAGRVVTASTYADLSALAQSAEPLVIRVEGTISNGPNGGVVRVASDKSIIGVGSTAFLDGVGIDINGADNIILQNLRVSMLGVTTRTATAGVFDPVEGILVNDGDAISIRGTSKNVWVDHCELFSEDPNVQTNIDLYDGLIDIKNQTGFITVSWTYFHDHHKGGLVGASDTDLFADRKVTFHHNFYENIHLRVPMYRGAVGHFFNNYVVGATDATEIRAGTCVRVEKNYYEPLHFSIYTPSDAPGSTERIDNIEAGRTSRAYPANCSADIPYPYADALTTNTNDVRTIVPQLAGVGKI